MAPNVFPDTGNVGLGTTNPRGALHILISGAPPSGLPAQENGLLLGIQDTGGYKWIQSYGGVLSLNPTGNNVGIGRTTATHRLDVNGAIRIRTNNATNLLVTGQDDDVFIDLVKNTNTTPAARIELEGFLSQTTHEGEIVFFTKRASDSSLQERMRIGANGDIAMGSDEQLRVGDSFGRAGINLRHPAFNTLRPGTRQQACINELGGGWFEIGDCLSAAEYAPMIDAGSGLPETGDLVSLVPRSKNPHEDQHAPFVVAKSDEPCDSNLLGIMSDPEYGASGKKRSDNYLPLAVSGYFPVKVTTENGSIKRGEPITSSSKTGYGMKATGACRIVGYALEDSEREGMIQAFASLGEYPGADVQGMQAQIQALETRLAELERQSLTREMTSIAPEPGQE
jgi:hypothetical protein